MKHVYLWSTVIGAILGGSWAIDAGDEIRGQQRSTTGEGGLKKALAPVSETIKQIVTVIVWLAVPVGAICGAALAALLHFMIWASGGIPTQRSSRRMSLSDEERRAFEKELKQAEAEGKEVWTRK